MATWTCSAARFLFFFGKQVCSAWVGRHFSCFGLGRPSLLREAKLLNQTSIKWFPNSGILLPNHRATRGRAWFIHPQKIETGHFEAILAAQRSLPCKLRCCLPSESTNLSSGSAWVQSAKGLTPHRRNCSGHSEDNKSNHTRHNNNYDRCSKHSELDIYNQAQTQTTRPTHTQAQ